MKNNLYTLLKADEKQARKIITKILKENGYEPVVAKDFIYAEGSIPVLLVAHYDTVPTPPKYIKNTKGVLSAKHGLGADDRAGIYAILETIVKHHCHVLFTGGEEMGGIGAKAFTKSGISPDVNYCIQLDRRGSNDAVYYDGANEEFEEFITSHGWETETGSFTDICILCPYLEVSGVNLSIGYQNEHRDEETLDTAVMNANIKRIPELLDGEKFEWIEAEYDWGYPSWYRGTYYGGGWDDWDDWDNSYSVRKKYEEKIYLVTFYNEDGEKDADESIGVDYFSAVGYFLMNHTTLTFEHIISIRADESDYTYAN